MVPDGATLDVADLRTTKFGPRLTVVVVVEDWLQAVVKHDGPGVGGTPPPVGSTDA